MTDKMTEQNSQAVRANEKKRPRLPAVEYIRGISMLGVVAIHVGSLYMENPAANLYLTAGFEALTRFCVPIFFFISAFGLFYNLREDFSYADFLQRRFSAVLVPYIFWSSLYVCHDSFFYDMPLLPMMDFLHALFFGTAKYHLYFLVVLIWFYVLMPLLIPLVKKCGAKTLAALFVFEVVFDYWSSYSSSLGAFVYSLPDSLLKDFFVYRLNFWVLHYIFIFVLGGFLARHAETFLQKRDKILPYLTAAFFASAAGMYAFFVWTVKVTGYNLVGATNTAHQLSPIGIVYTVCASLFFFVLFSPPNPQKNSLARFCGSNPALGFLGRHSYFVYLAHPLMLTYLVAPGEVFSAVHAVMLYCVVVALTLFVAVIFRALGEKIPLVGRLTIGR